MSELKVDGTKCIMCCLCEMACGFRRDEAFSTLASSVVIYRNEEKNNYFGVMLKQEKDLVLGRPEGLEVRRIGEAMDAEDTSAAAAKPVLLRESCDLCEGEAWCARFCPTGAIILS